MSNIEQHIDSNFDADEMIELHVRGLADVNTDRSSSILLLLSPADKGILELHNHGREMVFPIVVPPEIKFIFLYRVTNFFQKNPILSDLLDYYCKYTESTITHVSLLEIKGMVRGFAHFMTKEGLSGRFEVHLPQLIFTAMRYHLKIYMEQDLFIRGAKRAEVRIITDNDKEVAGGPISQEISKYILDATKPQEIEEERLSEIISQLGDEDKSRLIQLAIKHEQYEWAMWLEGLQDQDEYEE